MERKRQSADALQTTRPAPEGLEGARATGAMDANMIIDNASDTVFVSALEGRILQTNDAVSQLLGFRRDEVIEQSLSRSGAAFLVQLPQQESVLEPSIT